MADILKATNVAVRQFGEQVELQIGSQVLRMSYEEALQLSQWLRLRGRQAKKFAGDNWRQMSVICDLIALKE